MLQKSQNLGKYPCDSFREIGSHIYTMYNCDLKVDIGIAVDVVDVVFYVAF